MQTRAQVNIITTIAGTGVKGYSGDVGLAINAKFNRPYVICFDKDKNIIVCDAFNHAVRKINASGRQIYTIAGTGIPGYSGDGGLATDAQLEVPQGICSDSLGNIYIADAANSRVRKIDAGTGIITTIAGNGTAGGRGDGGLAVQAQIDGSAGLFYFKKNIYISDYNNNRVRKVNLETGIITAVAGNGIAGYSGDGGLAVNAQMNGVVDVSNDDNGNLYIVEQWNSVIRRVDAMTGKISTVVGSGTLGYSGDGGLAVNAEMNEPASIFIDKYNNLYISDYRNGAIRRVDAATKRINTVAGGAAGYGGDGGPALDAKLKCTDVLVHDDGSLYIADYVNHRIRRVNNAVGIVAPAVAVGLGIYPNPNTGKFCIDATEVETVTVCSLSGEKVLELLPATPQRELDITAQPPGVYLVYVHGSDGVRMGRVVKE